MKETGGEIEKELTTSLQTIEFKRKYRGKKCHKLCIYKSTLLNKYCYYDEPIKQGLRCPSCLKNIIRYWKNQKPISENKFKMSSPITRKVWL